MKTTILKTMAVAAALVATSALAQGKPDMNTPALSTGTVTQTSIGVVVTAGPTTGAPAGFSLQWMTAADYALRSGVWPDSTQMCAASFSGNASGSRYALAPSQSVEVTIGNFLLDAGTSVHGPEGVDCMAALLCQTDLVMRAFAHGDQTYNRSAFTNDFSASTSSCNNVTCQPTVFGVDYCTVTQGFWKTHGPIPTGGNANDWPVTSMTIGSVSYSALQLQAIFNTSPSFGMAKGSNGLISMAHQLIAAKLNRAMSTSPSSDPIDATILTAQLMIGNLVIPPIGTGYLSPSSTSALTAALAAYNEGTTGPGHCGSSQICR